MPCDILTVNDTKYTVLRLLGKGKGGYSYLVTDGRAQYVLKQIHHEPWDFEHWGLPVWTAQAAERAEDA